jgi:hypothetical protein
VNKYTIFKRLVTDEYMGLAGTDAGSLDPNVVCRVVDEMLHDGLMAFGKGRYWITSRGRGAYADMCKAPSMDLGSERRRFKDEVLSGMTTAGKETAIEQAVTR